MRAFLAILVAAAVAGQVQAQELTVVSEAVYAPAGAQQFVVHSETVGRDYVVIVSAPILETYGVQGRRPVGERFPAIYALDGGYRIAGPLAQMMASEGVMSPAYVVAIRYKDGEDFRNTDLLHHEALETTGTIGGGGAKFETFLLKELRPYLEKRYPLDPGRAVLFGHSFGGLFAANVLVRAPDAFWGYIIASPSTSRDADLMRDLPAAAKKAAAKRIYVSAGGQEIAQMKAGAEKVAAVLTAGGATVQYRSFEGEGHISYYPQLVPAAFAWMLGLEKQATSVAVAVGPAMLDRLVGDYKNDDGRITTIVRREGKLFARITGLPGEAELDAQSPTKFAITAYGVGFSFEGAENGPATDLTVRINGADTHAVRQSP